MIRDMAFETKDKRSRKGNKQSGLGFDELGIAPNLLKSVRRLNFKNPTPIQEQAIPAAITGDDILATAQTGSGKTLAFGIPMIQRLLSAKHSTGLVVVPTRELAIQVDEALLAVGRLLHIRTAVLIGGASMSMQIKALKKNPRVIIATPGRLMDHLQRKTANLSKVGVLVLDEADRMLDMGFAPDIKKIVKYVPEKRQTMLFSATMPKAIENIAAQILVKPTRIEISPSGSTPIEVSHEMFFIKHRDKSRLLAVQLQKCSGPVLVFTRTKRMATRLTTKVKDMGFMAAEIHSNRSQAQRRSALEGFKRGKYQILVATDIAARGIDVTGIEMVVNYDMPANSEDYVHRTGRTGRAGKTGHAVSFATNDQRQDVGHLERFMKNKLAISKLPSLPSEYRLTGQTSRRRIKDEVSVEKRSTDNRSADRPSTDKPSKKRPSKPRDMERRYFKKFAKKRIESKKKKAHRKGQNRTSSSSSRARSGGQD